MQLPLCNQFTRIGLDRENASVDSVRCYQHSAAVQHHSLSSTVITLMLSKPCSFWTVLISTTLIKDWFIQSWLTGRPLSSMTVPAVRDPCRWWLTACWEWLYLLMTDGVCGSFSRNLLRWLYSWVGIGCQDPCKNLIKNDMGIIKEFFNIHNNKRT